MTRIFSLGGFALVLLIAASPAHGQTSQNKESDTAFLSRMQSELRRLERWADNLDTAAQQRMGMATTSGSRIGVTGGTTPGRVGREPTSSELRRMRFDLRSMKKRLASEREQLERDFGLRDTEGFDRSHWEAVVRRFDHDLREMERDLRQY